MKNEYENQAVAPEVAPLEKDYTFWVIVDENDDIVSVEHPVWGDLKAVFGDKGDADTALSISDKESSGWRVVAAEIMEEE